MALAKPPVEAVTVIFFESPPPLLYWLDVFEGESLAGFPLTATNCATNVCKPLLERVGAVDKTNRQII